MTEREHTAEVGTSDKNQVRDEEQKATAEIIRTKENVNLPEIMQRMIPMFETVVSRVKQNGDRKHRE